MSITSVKRKPVFARTPEFAAAVVDRDEILGHASAGLLKGWKIMQTIQDAYNI
jgi:hypothetical protein